MNGQGKCDTHTHTHTHTHIHTIILHSHTEDESMPSETIWKDLVGIIESKISKTEKDKYHMIPLISGM